MLELRIKAGRRTMPIFDLPEALGRDQAAREVGDTIEGLISFLDDLGGDPDLETTGAEDDFMNHPLACGVFPHGPGCPVADPDYGVEELTEGYETGDRTHAEWHTLPSARRRAGNIDGKTISGICIDDDAEDDDPDTSVEDSPEGFDPETDMEHDGREPDDCDMGFCHHYAIDQTKPLDTYHGAPVSIEALT